MARLIISADQLLQQRLAEHKTFLNLQGKVLSVLNLEVDSDDRIEEYTGFYGGHSLCSMGAFSYSMSRLVPGMSIGRYCSIGAGLTVTGTRHAHEWVTTSNVAYARNGPVLRAYFGDEQEPLTALSVDSLQKPLPVIGNDVWIAQNVTLNRGVRVGNGAVIAANSVVTKDVLAYTIVGGNPAAVIRPRFPEHQVYALQDLGWWNYTPHQFMHLDLTNVERFIRTFLPIVDDMAPFVPRALTGAYLESYARGSSSR